MIEERDAVRKSGPKEPSSMAGNVPTKSRPIMRFSEVMRAAWILDSAFCAELGFVTPGITNVIDLCIGKTPESNLAVISKLLQNVTALGDPDVGALK